MKSSKSNKKEILINASFSLTFDLLPSSYINRGNVLKQIYDDFSLDYPLSHIYIICGIKRSGKTVLLTNVSNMIKGNTNCIISSKSTKSRYGKI